MCNETEKLFGLHFCLFHSTSPEEFKTRLEEHHKQESVEKRSSGENRRFSSPSDPKEEIAKCSSPAFTRQKVRTFLLCTVFVQYMYSICWKYYCHRLPTHHNNRIPYAVNMSVSRS